MIITSTGSKGDVVRSSGQGWPRIKDFSIVDSGVLNITVPDDAVYFFQYEHGLGYEPAVLVYQAEESPGLKSRPLPVLSIDSSGTVLTHVYAIVDDTYLTIWVEQYDTPVETLIDIRFFLLRESSS